MTIWWMTLISTYILSWIAVKTGKSFIAIKTLLDIVQMCFYQQLCVQF